MIICIRCNIEKEDKAFHKRANRTKTGKQSFCKECSRLISAERRARIKIEVFSHYSPNLECACCAENGHIDFLAIDHIENDGAQHRRSINLQCAGFRFYCWLKRNKYPEGYQILCHTCNVAKQICGECPHKNMLPDSVTVNTFGSEPKESWLESKLGSQI